MKRRQLLLPGPVDDFSCGSPAIRGQHLKLHTLTVRLVARDELPAFL